MARHLRLAPVPPAETSSSRLSPIRVVVADNHQLMRRSLALLLEQEPGLEILGEADALSSAIEHVLEDHPDVLVLDLGMPGGSSFETIADMRRGAPGTQIVALTMNDDTVFARRALEAGALGFVLKQRADQELPMAVFAAARGETYVSPGVAARLAAPYPRPVEDQSLTAKSSRGG